MPHYDKLNAAYETFAAQQRAKTGAAFHTPEMGHPRYSESITSFLCTRSAYQIYLDADKQFDALNAGALKFPDHKPGPKPLTNAEALAEARSFREYAIRKGRRGTRHH